MEPKFKLISSNNFDLFETRLNDFIASLDRDTVIVDVEFATAALEASIEFSALVHYQETESWDD